MERYIHINPSRGGLKVVIHRYPNGMTNKPMKRTAYETASPLVERLLSRILSEAPHTTVEIYGGEISLCTYFPKGNTAQ